MHVLYLSSYFPVLSETFVYNEVLRLRANGLTVSTATLREPSNEYVSPELANLAQEVIPVYGRGFTALLGDALREAVTHPVRGLATVLKGFSDMLLGSDLPWRERPKVCLQVLAALALAKRIRSRDIDHIHAHFAHAPTTIAMYLARQLGLTFSFTGHANDLFQRRTLLATKLRRAAFIACISHWHRAYYREFAPELPDERLPVIRCGVEIPEALSNMPNDPPHILAVGRLVPKKGFDVLIKALAKLNEEGLHFNCTLIGDGPQRDALKQLVEQNKLDQHVTLHGAAAHAEILETLQQADLFVLPCQPDSAGDRDGIPVALMEAMAAGKTVISGDLPAIRELIKDGDTGCLVPPGQVEPLTHLIRRLLDDQKLRATFGHAAREWVSQEFSAAINTRRLERALLAATAAQGHSAAIQDRSINSNSVTRES